MITNSTTSDQESSRKQFLQGLRHVHDPVLCLLIAVLLVRTFLVQGYLISTGSMAPHYYGRHKLATCSACGYQFAVGTEFDQPRSLTEIDMSEWAICPNCLADDAELSDLPVNRGDHLLVWKNAYEFRDPRRWEVIVFQNPNEPVSTYIKRIVGLPGEEIQLQEGNIWVDGSVLRKPLDVQRALRIPVFDHEFTPADDESWSPRWSADRDVSGWSRTTSGWKYDPEEVPAEGGTGDWLSYQHTLRYGGAHKTVVSLKQALAPAVLEAFREKSTTFPFSPEPAFPGLRYDEGSHCLVATGVIPEVIKNKLLPLDPSPEFQAAVDEVIRKSRLAPVTDFYAYNHQSISLREAGISEFFFETTIIPSAGEGLIVVSLSVPNHEFLCRLDPEHSRIELIDALSGEMVRKASWSFQPPEEIHLELSSFDRQISVGVNGRELFDSWELTPHVDDRPMPEKLVKIAGTMSFELSSLKLYRDVFYTTEPGDRAVRQPYLIPERQYFVLGDNSPVSQDSRRWEISTVPRRMLVGKPFLVHLPSKQDKVVWRGREFRYRLPDFSRIRFVR